MPTANASRAQYQASTVTPPTCAGSVVRLYQSGIVMRPSVHAQHTTATVNPTMPIGSSSRCQPRSFHVWASANIALRRSRIQRSCWLGLPSTDSTGR